MRDPKRISEALELINEIWSKNPDLRFFQLLDHLTYKYKVYSEVQDVDLFNLEDDKFIAFLKLYKERQAF